MTAAFLCASLGIVPTVRHADYIGSWLEVLRDDDRAIIRATSAASKAADYLLAFQADAGEPEGPSRPAFPALAPERSYGDERSAAIPGYVGGHLWKDSTCLPRRKSLPQLRPSIPIRSSSRSR
ncbi:zincin-like metallopeptidase domain-containing protein [Acidibrevibacterium fodinaquatile]